MKKEEIKSIKKEEIEKVKKDTKNFFTEFKTFIGRGNVLDLAVGVIMGNAFGKIVTSLVNDIIMPLVGVLIGGNDLSQLSVKVGDASVAYGAFIQNIIDFLIIALCIFIMIRIINKILRKKEKEERERIEKEKKGKEAVAVKPEDILLLQEIRDLLKNKKA